MSDVDSEEEQILARTRRAWAPCESDAERVRIALQTALGSPGAIPGATNRGTHTEATTPAPASPSTAASASMHATPLLTAAAKWLAGALVVASATVGGYRLGLRDGRHEGKPAIAVAVVRARPTTSVRVPQPSAAEATPPPAAVTPSAPPSPPQTSPAPLPPRPIVTSTPAAQTPSIQLELRGLRRVERALRDDFPALAIRVLTQLDREVPHSQMLEERAAAWALARCATLRSSAIADDFAQRYPRSVYAERVSTGCGAPAADSVSADQKQP